MMLELTMCGQKFVIVLKPGMMQMQRAGKQIRLIPSREAMCGGTTAFRILGVLVVSYPALKSGACLPIMSRLQRILTNPHLPVSR